MSYPPQQNGWQPQQPQQPGYGVPAQGAQQGLPQGYPQYPQQAMPQVQPGYGYAAPAQPKPNPFAGTPVSDWVRDGAAVILLLVSLALPWSRVLTADSDTIITIAAVRVEVLLITLLSALTVSIGYLARIGAFGASFTAPKAALTRTLLNLPYVLLVVLYIVFDAVRLGDLGETFEVGVGLGPAAVVGLAGAILAAVPRRYEILSPAFSATAAKHGYGFTVGYFAFAAVTTLLGIVLSIIGTVQNLDGTETNGFLVTVGIVFKILIALSPLVLTLFVLRRSEAARLIALAYGIAMVSGTFIAVFSSQGVPESVGESFGYPALVLAAAAGVMSHAGLPYAMRQQQPLASWHGALKQAPVALIAGLLLFVILCVAIIIAAEGEKIGFVVGVLICLVLSIIAAIVLRMQLASNFLHGRVMSASIAGGILVAGLVAVILAGVHNTQLLEGLKAAEVREYFFMLGAGFFSIITFSLPWLLTAFFAAPALVLYGIFAPKPVRDYFAAARPAQAAPQQYQTGAYGAGAYDTGSYQTGAFRTGAYDAAAFAAVQGQQAPQPQAHPQQAAQPQQAQPQVDPALAARAADPATPASEQFELSKQRELWPYLAQNPSLYDDLANWLAQTGDPQTLAALQARGR